MNEIEFRSFGKIPRLFRDIVITEKIDGTNAAVGVQLWTADKEPRNDLTVIPGTSGDLYAVYAQSRNRIITPDADNFGFAQWVEDHAPILVDTLGKGLHYGEWWGQGIQRGYGLTEKRFSLFNTHRWYDVDLTAVDGLGVVPTLYQGPFSTDDVVYALNVLNTDGSLAAPGFLNPEGVCVNHSASKQVFKYTVDDTAKSAA